MSQDKVETKAPTRAFFATTSMVAPIALPSPVTGGSPHSRRLHVLLPRRHRPYLALIALAACAGFFLFHSFSSDDPLSAYLRDLPEPEGGPNPPRFAAWHEREQQLPQHNPDLPYPQGRNGRYIRFSNQIFGLGWGNAMQEMLFNAHLAYLSKRTYVFDNYTWEKTANDFSDFNGKPIPARVPLTALVVGPIAGDPFPAHTGMPPAVNVEFFNEVCPNRTVIDKAEVNDALSDASASTILQAWLDKLERVDDRCIEIKEYSGQIFDFWLFGDSRRLLDIWPSISSSPILTHWAWSPLLVAALALNAHAIHPALASPPPPHSPSSNLPALTGLLALHIRRGDFIDHCTGLANWSSRYMGFNELPGLPDRFAEASPPSAGNAPPEEHARYRAHCFPEIEQIVARVRAVRAELHPRVPLSRVYVLTNGRPEWLAELKDALQADAQRTGMPRWANIGTSRDVRLTGEQRHNAQAMDMAAAQRAEVFLGNGFSSLTSNVVMLRAAQGVPWDQSRFW
ncbi:hypothetical protein BC834DRAFT_967221 [Gloeopeniophorella convolvens]|nr:hypothetical protein BC834DRAFT_967221 [Gloeopeniophorella convolvens]